MIFKHLIRWIYFIKSHNLRFVKLHLSKCIYVFVWVYVRVLDICILKLFSLLFGHLFDRIFMSLSTLNHFILKWCTHSITKMHVITFNEYKRKKKKQRKKYVFLYMSKTHQPNTTFDMTNKIWKKKKKICLRKKNEKLHVTNTQLLLVHVSYVLFLFLRQHSPYGFHGWK